MPKTMNLPELSSRTMFYHLQMMNAQNSKIFKFNGLLGMGRFLTPLFLRKTYKQNFGIQPTISNYLKRSMSRIGQLLWSIVGSKQANLPVCCSKFAMMAKPS